MTPNDPSVKSSRLALGPENADQTSQWCIVQNEETLLEPLLEGGASNVNVIVYQNILLTRGCKVRL